MNQNVKTKREFPYVTVLLIVLFALAAAVLVYSLINSTGVIGRSKTAVSSDHFKVNENQLCVYKYQAAQDQFYNMWLYDYYGFTNYGYKNYDLDQFVNLMIYNTVQADDDAFDAQAYAYAEQYLIYCEGAKEAGYTLSDEDKAEIDKYMENLELLADANSVSLSDYIHHWMGTGVSKKDVRKAMETYYLGIKYADKKYDELSDKVTEDEMKKEENWPSYYTTKYTYYVLPDLKLAEKAEQCTSVDEIKKMIIDYYMDSLFEDNYKAQITDKNIVDVTGKDQTRADVLQTILAWEKLTEDKAVFVAPGSTETETSTGETTETTAAETTAAEDATTEEEATAEETTAAETDAPALQAETDEETTTAEETTINEQKNALLYNTAGYDIATTIDTKVKTQISAIKDTGSAAYIASADDATTDLQKWLAGSGRKKDDSTVIKTTSTDSKNVTTTTATWYVVTDTFVKDEEKTKKAYFIQIKDDATKDSDGNEIADAKTGEQKWEAFKADPTEENFKKIFGASLNSSVSKSSVNPEKVGDWLFAEGRKEGDYDRIEIETVSTSNGTTTTVKTYYAVMFMGENEETWKVNARKAIAERELTAWADAIRETYHVTSNYVEPETSEAATSTAADTTAATTEAVTTEAATTKAAS